MDILTHTLSGMAIGTVVCSFSKHGFPDRTKIMVASTIGGAFPDIDAISLWSKFDSTIGKFLHLDHSGRDIYFGKFWYSHHAFFHSLAGAISVGFIGWFIIFLLKNKFKEIQLAKIKTALFQPALGLIGFVSGYTLHLFEDMPTPSGSWGGINFFWPSKSYIGGTADIWWWNNYDIFLLAVMVILLNSIVHFIRRFYTFKHQFISIIIFLACFGVGLNQIKKRPSYLSNGRGKSKEHLTEEGSLKIQRAVLGDWLFIKMERLDGVVVVYF
jgi:inner membrane protein